MNQEQFHQTYQSQIRLVRHIHSTFQNSWGITSHTLELNRLHQFDQIEDTIKNIDLNLYTIFPFDTSNYSSYILFSRSFSHELSLLSINLNHDDIRINEASASVLEQFCCYKITEMIANYYKTMDVPITFTKEPTTVNLDQLSEFSSELLVSNISLNKNQTNLGNFYIIFPKSLLGESQ